VTSFTEAHAAYETVKSLFQWPSFGGFNGHNILSLGLALQNKKKKTICTRVVRQLLFVCDFSWLKRTM
jgi:hypothetical protein